MNRVIVIAPALVNCGYGCHSKEIIEALEKIDNVDLMCNLLTWGQCGWLISGDYKDRVSQYAVKHANWNNKVPKEIPDLILHLTVPNEFKRVFNSKYIGITAGIEAEPVHPDWIVNINNNINHLVVPSSFTKNTFLKSGVTAQNNITGETFEIRINKPITVIPESVDIDIYNPKVECKLDINFEPDFNFLSVCQWGSGNLGEERKNTALMIKWFKEAFKNDKNVGLVLKCNIINNSLMDREALLRRINDLKNAFSFADYPKVYVIHDYLTGEQMSQLYNHPKIKAYLTLTHGEGYGLPLIEATACNKPVIATDWSGHKEFLDLGKWIKLDYEMIPVPPVHHGGLFVAGSQWASPKEEDTKRKMRRIVENYSIPKEWAVDLGKKVRDKFNKNAIHNMWKEFLIGEKFIDPDKDKDKLVEIQDFD